MATAFLVRRTSPKYLFQPRLHSSSSSSSPLLQNLCSLLFRDSTSCNRPNSFPSYSRSFVSGPEDSGAPALGSDTRVPATVITGFLGSGKVLFLSFFLCSLIFCVIVDMQSMSIFSTSELARIVVDSSVCE